jgi:hypothetical protein
MAMLNNQMVYGQNMEIYHAGFSYSAEKVLKNDLVRVGRHPIFILGR